MLARDRRRDEILAVRRLAHDRTLPGENCGPAAHSLYTNVVAADDRATRSRAAGEVDLADRSLAGAQPEYDLRARGANALELLHHCSQMESLAAVMPGGARRKSIGGRSDQNSRGRQGQHGADRDSRVPGPRAMPH